MLRQALCGARLWRYHLAYIRRARKHLHAESSACSSTIMAAALRGAAMPRSPRCGCGIFSDEIEHRNSGMKVYKGAARRLLVP